MSKIALSGDAAGTGTFTIASPNSNNNRTLTLPDATGTVVVTGGAQTIEFAAGSASAPSVAFTGDTNTGIYSPGADRIGFTEGGVQTGEFDASGNFLFNSGYGSVAVAYGCRAWVNFNGTGAVAIRASGNVTTITDNGTGDYTVNFTNALPDANYTVGGITMRGSSNTDNLLFLPLNGTYTSTACRVLCAAPSNSGLLLDAVIVNVFFFR
jgi:hypothetical protein